MLLRPALKPELLRRVESLDLLLSPEVSPLEGAGHRIRFVNDEGDSPPTGTMFFLVRARTKRIVIFEMPSMVPARGSFLTWLGLGLGLGLLRVKVRVRVRARARVRARVRVRVCCVRQHTGRQFPRNCTRRRSLF